MTTPKQYSIIDSKVYDLDREKNGRFPKRKS